MPGNPQTTALADQYAALARNLDNLYVAVISAGDGTDAVQIQNFQASLRQAASDLYATDVIDTLTDQASQQKLVNLTNALNAKNQQISAQQAKLSTVFSLFASLVTVATDLTLPVPNIVGGVSAAQQAITTIGSL